MFQNIINIKTQYDEVNKKLYDLVEYKLPFCRVENIFYQYKKEYNLLKEHNNTLIYILNKKHIKLCLNLIKIYKFFKPK